MKICEKFLNKMVRPRGFEPLTYGLEGRCSIQLSYERKEVMVRTRGLEPPRREAPDPKSGVSANFTTSA